MTASLAMIGGYFETSVFGHHTQARDDSIRHLVVGGALNKCPESNSDCGISHPGDTYRLYFCFPASGHALRIDCRLFLR